MAEPRVRFKQDDGSSYPDIQQIPFGEVVKPFVEKTKIENEDVLLSCAINGVFLNTELFGHQRGASNKGYKKIRRNTLILSAQNLHLGNANVNQRFDHGIISPAYNTYDIVGCDPDYMAQWVKREATKKFFYDATTTGASQCRRNVDWNALYEQIFYVPCEEEQKKIADFLSSVDEVIAASEQEVANLETQKKAVMKKIFSQEVRFKREDGTDFPEWEENMLGNIGRAAGGVGFPEKYQGHRDLPIPIYKVSDMNTPGNEVYMVSSNNYVSAELLQQMKAKPCTNTSIIFAKVGAAVFLDRKRIANSPFLVDNNMMVFTPSCEEIDFQFL